MAKKRKKSAPKRRRRTSEHESLSSSVFGQVIVEREQSFESRRPLLQRIETALRCPVVTYFTSFQYPTVISDTDADILEDIFRTADLSKGLTLIISSPGGSGLAAERIINLCRSYSGTGQFNVIVPGKAKSAATLVCFGASKITMGPSAELGPVDPQVVLKDEKGMAYQFAVHNVVNSYEKLFDEAVKATGRLEPYLQQLDKYDAREIEEYKSEIELSKDMAIKALKSGMMSRFNEDTVGKKIAVFLNPGQTKSHGRPIFRNEAKKCGLKVVNAKVATRTWKMVHELYVRSYHFTNSHAIKSVESSGDCFAVPAPGR